MSTVTAAPPPMFANYQTLRRFTVAEYHQMIQTGILDDEDKVELLEGYVVLKMPRNPPHDGTIQVAVARLQRCLPSGWCIRTQSAITLTDSEPEPDLAVVRGDTRTYLTRHPAPSDVGLLIEIANTSLDRDRNEKARIYAGGGIPIYWIINLVNKQIEVFTSASGPSAAPAYAQRQDYALGSAVPLELDGVLLAHIPASDLLP